jgi:ring-1,2-phenylacetyl-CoA epoxidase subunit PaaD
MVVFADKLHILPNSVSSRKKITALLSEVPDPEIPGVSIVDLGMVVNISCESEVWLIELAPTYSGCPAIDVIPIMVENKIREAGYSNFIVRMQISPPWSTDWISEEGKEKLNVYGIAPPNGKASEQPYEGKPKSCPQCGSIEIELISRYGATPCKASYKCLSCLEPFEYFKRF